MSIEELKEKVYKDWIKKEKMKKTKAFEAWGTENVKPAIYPYPIVKGSKFTEQICDARSKWNRSCYRPKGHTGMHESRMLGEHPELALARWKDIKKKVSV